MKSVDIEAARLCHLLLISSIRKDMAAISKIYQELAAHQPLTANAGQDELIVVAYYLHNLYNAFENIFQNIGATFENSIDDISKGHAQLLERMRLEVMPLRPAVIDDAAYEALDELRRFRHLFRHAYSLKLDQRRLALVLDSALALQAMYEAQLGQFTGFLQGLTGSEPALDYRRAQARFQARDL